MFCPYCGKSTNAGHQFCVHCGKGLGGSLVPSVSSSSRVIEPAAVYAGFWRRALAIIVDAAILTGAVIVIDVVLAASGLAGSKDAVRGFGALIGLFGGWLYFALFESSSLGATPGKLLIGIRVTDLEGNRIRFWHSAGRNVARILSGLPLYAGYIAAGLTKRKQAFHDMVASTLVVRRGASQVQIAADAGKEGEWGVVIAVVATVVGAIFVIGILLAIAIPAYQNYALRAQVAQGIALVAPYKTAVADAIVSRRQLQLINSKSLNIDASASGKYVTSIRVISGVIAIEYGNQANARLSGKTLAIYPSVGANSGVAWICGLAPVPEGFTSLLSGAEQYTSVPAAYLPSSCHQ
jgi:uncharacterized RDD family membrane protein YckC/Tfp pilus assembly major pilin PilA